MLQRIKLSKKKYNERSVEGRGKKAREHLRGENDPRKEKGGKGSEDEVEQVE